MNTTATMTTKSNGNGTHNATSKSARGRFAKPPKSRRAAVQDEPRTAADAQCGPVDPVRARFEAALAPLIEVARARGLAEDDALNQADDGEFARMEREHASYFGGRVFVDLRMQGYDKAPDGNVTDLHVEGVMVPAGCLPLLGLALAGLAYLADPGRIGPNEEAPGTGDVAAVARALRMRPPEFVAELRRGLERSESVGR